VEFDERQWNDHGKSEEQKPVGVLRHRQLSEDESEITPVAPQERLSLRGERIGGSEDRKIQDS
jgi:hypothetical protein